MHRSLFFVALSSSLVIAGCDAGSTPITRRDGGGGTEVDGGSAPRPDTGPLPPRPDAGPPRAGDADNDGLPDADEVARGTDPNDDDSDDDGYTDGVEVLAGTDPSNGSDFIPPDDFYVVLPYMDPAQQRELDFTARLGRGDVFFLVDTTGSMGLAIDNVSSSLAGEIVPAISAAIADVVMGVGDYRDFAIGEYGNAGDWPFLVRQAMTADVGAVQSALDGLRAGGGGDGPESMVEGLYGAVAGSCPGGSGFGQACFRESSHPILVVVSDAPMHNGPGGDDAYGSDVPSARTYSEATAALNAQSVKVVGVGVGVSLGGISFPSGATDHLEQLATDTSSRSASGGVTVFEAPGGEVSGAVVDGIVDLVGATTQDVTSRTLDDESDAVDAREFITAVTPLRASRATSFDATTFYGVSGGTTITFQVTFQNDFLPHQAYVQIFLAYIEVFDTVSSTVLDRRNVYIVVPAVGGVLI